MKQTTLTIEQLDDMAAQIESHKAALALREESKEHFEKAKERFILAHQDEWLKTGKHYRALRIGKGLSQESVAIALGVSASKISNFESGKSITHAKLVANAYKMFLELREAVECFDVIGHAMQCINDGKDMAEDTVCKAFIKQIGVQH